MRVLRVFRHLVVLLGLFGLGCLGLSEQPSESGLVGVKKQSVVYGKDDRVDVHKHTDARLRKFANSVAVSVRSSAVKLDTKTGVVTLIGSDFTTKVKKSSKYGKGLFGLCSDEPFRNEPAPGSCTFFLISKRIVATAAHCISKLSKPSAQTLQRWCYSRRVVFGYMNAPDGKLKPLGKNDLYSCRRVLTHHYTSSPKLDIATFELDRDVVGRDPLLYDLSFSLKKGDQLAVIGHPHGIPVKIATGARVFSTRSTHDYFVTNLDTSPGNSGSPVFSMASYKIVGVHVRGARPVFTLDQKRKCMATYKLSDKVGRQSATYFKPGMPLKCKQSTDCKDSRMTCEKGLCLFQTTDLSITSMKLSPSNPKIGSTATLSFEIQNKGSFRITRSFRFGLWWSSNTTICPSCGTDKFISSRSIPPIDAGASYKGTIRFSLGASFRSGTQYLGAFADDYSTRPSSLGVIYEENEKNNASYLKLLLKNCPDRCPSDGFLRCEGKRIDRCEKQTSGCLDWQTIRYCSATETCVKGSCKKNCQDKCQSVNLKKCEGQDVKICEKQSDGCLGWSVSKTCGVEQLCKETSCVSLPKKKLGETCLQDGDCDSGVCSDVVANEKKCSLRCKSHSDCNLAKDYRFCDKTVCKKLPSGACLSESDCAKGKICSKNICKAKPAEKEAGDGGVGEMKLPSEKEGCGCSVHEERSLFGYLSVYALFLLLFFSRRFTQKKKA